MKQVEIFIIGHGLAGTLLSHFLSQQNISHHVIDPNHHESASMVAAGLMDYISGKRLSKSWNSDTLIPFALETYSTLEKKLNCSFLTQAPSLRLFLSDDECRFFDKKQSQPEFTSHYGPSFKDTPFPFLKNPIPGGAWINTTSSISTTTLLEAHHDYLCSKQKYSNGSYTFSSFSDSYTHEHITAKRLVFCTGADTMSLPFLQHLPFRPAQGETLTVNIPSLPSNHVTNIGKWFVPVGKSTFKFGATYEWKTLSRTPTSEGKNELLSFISEHIEGDVSIKDHQAGIRCMVSDVRPCIGFLNDQPSVGVFSGFGSKGVMITPYYAAQLASHIANGTPIDDEVSIGRFF